MRHKKNTVKLGRPSGQREALMSSLLSNLVIYKRITTTLPKARAAKRHADKLITVSRKANALAARREASSILKSPKAVRELFDAVGPATGERAGGYTRIVKLGKRMSDSSEMCILEWVDFVPPAKEETTGKK